MRKSIPVITAATTALLAATPAFAQDAGSAGYYGLGAGIAMGFGVLRAGLGQGLAARGMYESISRNPQAAAKLNAPFYIGMAFIESLVAAFAFGIAYLLVTHK